jgi:hypothetical protein
MLHAEDDDQCRGEISEVLPITLMNECVCVRARLRGMLVILSDISTIVLVNMLSGILSAPCNLYAAYLSRRLRIVAVTTRPLLGAR